MRKVDPVKHEKKRREIIEAARVCFLRSGFQGASISEICAEARISPGHLYHYFASKEAIIGAQIEQALEDAAARFAPMMASTNPVEALVSEIERVGTSTRIGGQTIVLDALAEAVRNPTIAVAMQKHSKEVSAQLADVLRKAQHNGQGDRNLDADVAAAIIISIMDGMKTLAIRNPGLDTAKARDALKLLFGRFLSPAGTAEK